MGIHNDILETKLRLNSVVIKSKLGKSIVSNILNPVLDSIDEEMKDLSYWLGDFIVTALKHVIASSKPSGRTYRIILVGSGEHKYEDIGSYTASASGDPPNSMPGRAGVPTGTLMESISFEIIGDGKLKVGIFNSTGTELETLFYAGGKLFVSEGGGGSKTSVVDYATMLSKGTSRIEAKPWYEDTINELKPIIRAKVKETLHRAVRRASRRKAFGKAIYFRVYFK